MVRLFVCLLLSASCAGGTMDSIPMLELISPRTEDAVDGMIEFEVALQGEFEGDIELLANDELVYAWTPEPSLRHRLDTTTLDDGIYRFRVRGTTALGGELSDTTGLTIDNLGPQVELIEPTETTIYVEDGDLPIVVEVSDVVGVGNVVIMVGDTIIEEFASPTRTTLITSYDPTGDVGEDVFLTVEATDRLGRMTETGRSFSVRARERYSTFLDSAEFGPALLSEGAIAVGTDDKLTILEEDGSTRCEVLGNITSAPLTVATEQGTIFWSTLDMLHTVSAADCSILTSLSTNVVTGMDRLSSAVATVTFTGLLRSHDAATGAVVGEAEDLSLLAEGMLEVPAGLAYGPNRTVYVAGSLGPTRGALFIKPPDGETRFVSLPAAAIAGIVADETGVYIPAADGRCYAYSPTGEPLWRTPPALSEGAPIESTPVLVPDAVVVGDGLASVHSISRETGEVIWTHVIDERGAPIISRGGVATDGAGRFIGVGDRLGGITVITREGDRHFRSFISLGETTAVRGRPAISNDQVLAIDEVGLFVAYQL